VLEGLTTAIIVDQERMGANIRSTVGTATDANAMLRILFSRLGSRTSARRRRSRSTSPRSAGAGAVTIEKGGKEQGEARVQSPAACARAARAWARSPTST
jgi:excinuclease UvrABC ATPase subunit